MKKFLSLLLSVVMVTVLFCSCSGKEKNGRDGGKLKIVTTIFPPYDFAREVAGDKASLTMLLPFGGESHSYDPTAQDIIKIREADLFIYVGGESDQWVKEMLESSSKKPRKVLSMMDCVEKLEEEIVEGMQGEDEDKGDEVEYDEHVWTSPKNAVLITEKIKELLVELDGDNAEYYEKNAGSYEDKLKELDKELADITEKATRKTLVFGDRFPFKYFVDAYHLKYYAAFPGCSSETQPSASTVVFLIDKVSTEKIPVVFTIEFSNGKIADSICESTGAKKLTFHSCHNITKEEFDGGISYLKLMQKNAENLKEALS